MAKQSGLGDNLYVAGYNLSGDIGSLDRIGGGPQPLESTGIDKSAMERLGGLLDGGFEYNAFFNKTAGQAHPRLSILPRTSVIMTYCRGTAIGSPSASMVAKQVNYDGSRGTDGSFTFSVQALATDWGVEWGRLLTAGRRSDAAADEGDAVDFGASHSFGLQAYLHVFSVTGTSVTVKLQESADEDGTPDTWADVTGGGFTAATGIASQRIVTARNLTVERYLRVVTTGTFSEATFAVHVCVNKTVVNF